MQVHGAGGSPAWADTKDSPVQARDNERRLRADGQAVPVIDGGDCPAGEPEMLAAVVAVTGDRRSRSIDRGLRMNATGVDPLCARARGIVINAGSDAPGRRGSVRWRFCLFEAASGTAAVAGDRHREVVVRSEWSRRRL